MGSIVLCSELFNCFQNSFQLFGFPLAVTIAPFSWTVLHLVENAVTVVILLIRFDFKTQQTEIAFRLSGVSSKCAFKREGEVNQGTQGKNLRKTLTGENVSGVSP